MRDEVMTGVRPKADQKIIDNATASPAATHRWYTLNGGVWFYSPTRCRWTDEHMTNETEAIPESKMRDKPVCLPITYLRAREILGSAWPASWPQTDPDAPIAETLDDLNVRFSDPSKSAKAADADGYDYYTVNGYNIDDLWRYRPGAQDGEFLDYDATWEKSSTDRHEWGNNKDDFGPASRAACEAFLRGDKPNPDDHDDGSQSRRTGAATAAKCPGLLSPDEPKRTGAGLLPEGTDAQLPGDISAQFAEVNRLLAQARAICEKGLAAHEAWKAGRGKA